MSDIVERLGRRIYNQRARLRYWEELFDQHVHGHLHVLHPRHLMKAIELGNENFRLRQLLSEAETREREARVKAQAMHRRAQIAEGAFRGVMNVIDLWKPTLEFHGLSRHDGIMRSVKKDFDRAVKKARALQSEER